MSEWWESGYLGGPMVKVSGFPRPLYPPDAAPGHKPSTDGPDVVAYKRTISRLGRWPWQPFDDTFSNAFSHGRGDVGESGVAGVQRQQNISPTGFIGEQTFNLLRSAKIPAGLPHAGEYGMDEIAVSLLEDAYVREHPATPSLGPVFRGGKSVLDHDCTHATSGIELYPAFDDCFMEGEEIIAPEPLTVTRSSSSNPGHAFYADGNSGLRFWFGHLDRTHSPGVKFAKAAIVGRVCSNSQGGGPHVHVAVNVEKVWWPGAELTHKTSYSHGAPTIGAQLAAGGPL